MLYKEIVEYIDGRPLVKRQTTNEILHHPKETFTDILWLYILLARVNKWLFIKNIDSSWYKKVTDSNGKIIFNKNKFNQIIQSKWSKILFNDLILEWVLLDSLKLCEEYLENFILQNKPQYNFFIQFQKWDFEWLEYVFNYWAVSSSILFEYTTTEWVKKTFKDKAALASLNSEDCKEIFKHFTFPWDIWTKLARLSLWSFVRYRSYLLEAAQEVYAWRNILENGEYLLKIDKASKELEAKLLKDIKDKEIKEEKLAQRKKEAKLALAKANKEKIEEQVNNEFVETEKQDPF